MLLLLLLVVVVVIVVRNVIQQHSCFDIEEIADHGDLAMLVSSIQ